MPSIHDALSQLSQIINYFLMRDSKLSFFAALYYTMTSRISQAIDNDRFQDRARMDAFDGVFASQYLTAVHRCRLRERVPKCWMVSFEESSNPSLVILQHLLLGINAHINFDLGIALSQMFHTDKEQNAFRSDFDVINDILAELIDDVQANLATVSPSLLLLDQLGGRTDESLLGFSLSKARDQAWSFGVALSFAPSGGRSLLMRAQDQLVGGFGRMLSHRLLTVSLAPIRSTESSDLRAIVRAIQTASQ